MKKWQAFILDCILFGLMFYIAVDGINGSILKYILFFILAVVSAVSNYSQGLDRGVEIGRRR